MTSHSTYSTRSLGLLAGLLLLAALLPTAAAAVDGVLEINETCATQTGCFAGDTAGFPVEIIAAGSYRLTSNLTAANAISIQADFVTVDLNGFRLEGGGAANSVGVQAVVNPDGVEYALSVVKNGFVHRYEIGIALGYGARVENVSVTECSSQAVALGTGTPYPGMVRENVILGNTGTGLVLGSNAGYAGNVLGDNGTNVSGGSNMGGNVCDGSRCPHERRRYYLTTIFFDGAQAPSACVTGFHMANVHEIWNTAQLEYDTSLGVTASDSGLGPATLQSGWVRSGDSASSINCTGYTQNASNQTGTAASLLAALTLAGSVTGETPWSFDGTVPWDFHQFSCDSFVQVWCVED